MTLNPHDDYEALGKLLYPSIEASGNVYYGQTRKLTLDEVFDKNDKGFHSHIESLYNQDTGKYDAFLCWEIGPLHGIIKTPEMLPCLPMCFAKYEITAEPIQKDNPLYSGNFYTYENDVKAVFKSIELTRGKIPTNLSTDWDGANFYVESTGAKNYIYIALKDSSELNIEDPEEYEYEAPDYTEGNEFTFTVVSDTYNLNVQLKSKGAIANKTVYEYNKNNTGWYDFTADSTILDNLQLNDSIKFRHKSGTTKSPQGSSSNYLYISISGTGHIDVSGDFRSLQEDKLEIKYFEFSNFLKSCNNIISAANLVLPSATVYIGGLYSLFYSCENLKYPPIILPASELYDLCYSNMFEGCTSLLKAPKLPATDLTNKYSDYSTDVYSYMFKTCNSLKEAPELPSIHLSGYCYANMFEGCTSLSKVPMSLLRLLPSTSSVHCAFAYMFSGCQSLKEVPNLQSSFTSLTAMGQAFCGMFKDCPELKIPPKMYINGTVPSSYTWRDPFQSMFYGCEKLTVSPALFFSIKKCTSNDSSWHNTVKQMFKDCANLHTIYLYGTIEYDERDFTDWLSGVAENGDIYYDTDAITLPSGASGVPTGWTSHNIREAYSNGESEFNNKSEYLITSGTDYEFNGRGKLSDESSLYNMEKLFDENGTHQMNTYNDNGSYNQEIWGYKCFNSPVAFRNGIYDESSSITSSNLISNSTHDKQYCSSYRSYSFASDLDDVGTIHSGLTLSNSFRNTDGCCTSCSALLSSYDLPANVNFSNDFVNYSGGANAELDFSSLPESVAGVYATSIAKSGYLGITMTGTRAVLFSGNNGVSIDNSGDYPVKCNGNTEFNNSLKIDGNLIANNYSGNLPYPIADNYMNPQYPIGSFVVAKFEGTIDTNDYTSGLMFVPGSIIRKSSGSVYTIQYFSYKNNYDVWENSSDTLTVVAGAELYASDLSGYAIDKKSIPLYTNEALVLLNTVTVSNGTDIDGIVLLQVIKESN